MKKSILITLISVFIQCGLICSAVSASDHGWLVIFDDSEIESGLTAERRVGAVLSGRDLARRRVLGYGQLKSAIIPELPAGVSIRRDFSHLPLAHVKAESAADLKLLRAQPGVLAVVPNEEIELHLTQSLPLAEQPDAILGGQGGLGTSVVVVDSGVDYTRSVFGSCTAAGSPASCRVPVAFDVATGDGQLDDNGHGTNVAGIVAAMAPQADILSLDVINADGTSTDSLIIDAINWAIANQVTYNIRSINLSLGGSTGYSSPCQLFNPYTAAVNNARSAGISVVASAGNSGLTNMLARPACTPGVNSVGAVYDGNNGGLVWSVSAEETCTDTTTAADQVPCFSNSADFLTLMAPGALITAANLTYGGTSQAAPHVSGAIAVLSRAFPAETPDQLTTRLVNFGSPVVDARNGLTVPRLDLFAALDFQADLSLSTSIAPDPLVFNEQADVTLTVENLGPDPAVHVELTSALPDGSDFISASPECSLQGRDVICQIDVLDSGESSSFQLSVLPTVSGDFNLTTGLSSPTSDADGSNNSVAIASSVTAPAVPAVDRRIVLLLLFLIFSSLVSYRFVRKRVEK